jgi:hypothetical protein
MRQRQGVDNPIALRPAPQTRSKTGQRVLVIGLDSAVADLIVRWCQ